MKTWIKPFILAPVVLGLFIAFLGRSAHGALITDSSSFTAFSVTYDQAVWGTLKFAHEADSFTGTLPISQFGFGRFFFDPGFKVSSDGSAGPTNFTLNGQIIFNAKPGWGLYDINFVQSGQWAATGSGAVSVNGSFVDVSGANAQFFFTDHRAFTDLLFQAPDGENGYYYIIGERSSISRFNQLTIDYDIELNATTNGPGFAKLFSDVSDPSTLGGSGPYPSGSNVVGTFVSASFERVAVTPEPASYVLVLVGLAMFWFVGITCRNRRSRLLVRN